MSPSSYCPKLSSVCVVESQREKEQKPITTSQKADSLLQVMVGAEAKIMIAWKATQQVIQQEGKCIQDLWINASENKLKFINKSEEKEVIKNWLEKPTLT